MCSEPRRFLNKYLHRIMLQLGLAESNFSRNAIQVQQSNLELLLTMKHLKHTNMAS
jgi:hypothetical protein